MTTAPIIQFGIETEIGIARDGEEDLDLVVEAGLKSWDIEAAVPVIEGAGGLVTDWRGTRIGRDGGQMAIAGDRALLDEALATLRPAAK